MPSACHFPDCFDCCFFLLSPAIKKLFFATFFDCPSSGPRKCPNPTGHTSGRWKRGTSKENTSLLPRTSPYMPNSWLRVYLLGKHGCDKVALSWKVLPRPSRVSPELCHFLFLPCGALGLCMEIRHVLVFVRLWERTFFVLSRDFSRPSFAIRDDSTSVVAN